MSVNITSLDTAAPGLLYIGFNQDAGCFAVGMQNGFRVFNTDPLKQKERMDFTGREGTGVGFVEMLFRTNFLGILGGGPSPKMKSNMCMIWDDLKKKFVIEFEYASDIRAIRLRRDRTVLILDAAIKVYTFEPLPQLLHQYETGTNPSGLCAVCQASECARMAYPGKKMGSVELVDLLDVGKRGVSVAAHNSEVTMINMNQTGAMLATASEKGTLIRLFNTENAELMHELRRGSNPAIIYSVAFNLESTLVCVSSDHGTVHIFRLDEDKSVKSRGLLPRYFSSHVSEVKCCLRAKVKAICAFSTTSPNTVIVLGADGTYSKYRFTAQGESTRDTFVNFLDFDDDDSDF